MNEKLYHDLGDLHNTTSSASLMLISVAKFHLLSWSIFSRYHVFQVDAHVKKPFYN